MDVFAKLCSKEEKRVNKRFKGFLNAIQLVSVFQDALKLAKSKTMCKVLTMTDVADLVACAQAGKVVQEDSEDQNWSSQISWVEMVDMLRLPILDIDVTPRDSKQVRA